MEAGHRKMSRLAELEALLREQTAAAQGGDPERSAALGDLCVGLLRELPGSGCGARDLLRVRDIAAYNQLLLRYAFTSWAAVCLDRQRRPIGYNALGRRIDLHERPAHAGQIAKGVL